MLNFLKITLLAIINISEVYISYKLIELDKKEHNKLYPSLLIDLTLGLSMIFQTFIILLD